MWTGWPKLLTMHDDTFIQPFLHIFINNIHSCVLTYFDVTLLVANKMSHTNTCVVQTNDKHY